MKRNARLLLLVLPIFFVFVPACGRSDHGYEHVYTTRGIIEALPGEKAYQDFMVHHETIPDYVSMTGSIGMNEMVMPFPLQDKSIVEGYEVGDKVEIVFGERFEPDHKMGVISITKLPADTEMTLGEAVSP